MPHSALLGPTGGAESPVLNVADEVYATNASRRRVDHCPAVCGATMGSKDVAAERLINTQNIVPLRKPVGEATVPASRLDLMSRP